MEKKLENKESEGIEIMETTMMDVLTNEVDIEKAERLSIRVAFSVFFRRMNAENYREELKSIEKIQRFLTNENNQSHLEKSNIWKGMLQQITKHQTEFSNAIETSTKREDKELAFLEEVKAHTYGEKLFDHDYFTTLFKYADMNEDTADFDPSLRNMMKQYGFITDEPKVEEKGEEQSA